MNITLIGTNEEREKTFNQLQALTNDKLQINSNTGKITIEKGKSTNQNLQLTEGTKMIYNLIENKEYDCKIRRDFSDDDGTNKSLDMKGFIDKNKTITYQQMLEQRLSE